MSENVFFNPGQSVSSDYDFDKAYVCLLYTSDAADD